MTVGNNKIDRSEVIPLNEILGIPFKVLDNGFIRVVDYMGSDDSIVQAARVSYGAGTKKASEDKNLIRYLMRHNHTTPFEMCEIKLHIKVPMDTWRQWIRHRTANVNEYSTRYSIAIDEYQKTDPLNWRIQATENKQGSGSYLDKSAGINFSSEEIDLHNQITKVYKNRIAGGIAREQARKDLALSTYTEAYWKIDLHNLFNFLMLRMDSHAQFEIRSYANIIGNEIVKRWCPIAWNSFVEYKLHGINFFEKELSILSSILSRKTSDEIKVQLMQLGFFIKNDYTKPTRELSEFENKLIKAGITLPWNNSNNITS